MDELKNKEIYKRCEKLFKERNKKRNITDYYYNLYTDFTCISSFKNGYDTIYSLTRCDKLCSININVTVNYEKPSPPQRKCLKQFLLLSRENCWDERSREAEELNELVSNSPCYISSTQYPL